MNEELKKEAEEMMNELGERSKSFMGLSPEEEGIFGVLLWLFAEGEKPEMD